jgi:hypothetical protein
MTKVCRQWHRLSELFYVKLESVDFSLFGDVSVLITFVVFTPVVTFHPCFTLLDKFAEL